MMKSLPGHGSVQNHLLMKKKQPMQRSPLTTFQIRELKRMYLPPATAVICSCSPSIRSCVLTIPAGTSGTDTALTSDLNSILFSDLILHVFFLLQANCLPIPSANHCLNCQNMIFIRFTVLSLLLPKKMTISSLMSTGTVILLFHATTGFSTMTAQTSSSRSKRLMISENTGNPKRTDRILSFRWDCSWMVTVFLLHSVHSAELPMSSLP